MLNINVKINDDIIRKLNETMTEIQQTRPFSFKTCRLKIVELDLDLIDFSLALNAPAFRQSDGKQPTICNQLNAMERNLDVMLVSVEAGLQDSSPFEDMNLPGDYGKRILKNTDPNNLSRMARAGAAAAIEHSNRMGIIVAAFTAGACGILPGVFWAFSKVFNTPKERLLEALIVASLIGRVAFGRGKVSGAAAGCGAEIGYTAMAAAASVVYLLGGNIDQMEAAAARIGQNYTGLTCAPEKGRVLVPCQKRNMTAASEAIEEGLDAMADCKEGHVGIDATIDRIQRIGEQLPTSFRETECQGWCETGMSEIANIHKILEG